MISGHTRIGDHFQTMSADSGYLMPVILPAGITVTQVVAAVDGFGLTHHGTQLLKAVLYAPGGDLVTESSEVSIVYGAGLSWLVLDLPEVFLSSAGTYKAGILAGSPLDGIARISAYNGLGHGLIYDDDYDTGPSSPLPTTTLTSDLTIWVTYSLPFAVPENVTDDWVATLPFSMAQQQLSKAVGPDTAAAVTADVGWHGTLTDPNLGSFAIVNRDGPLADMVGERLQVEYQDRKVYVYVHTDGDILEDLSLTRRTFMALAHAATTDLVANVAVMVPSP